ncbi:2-(3-amino-3-carboxypropyl)histidine synthase subunit 2 [Collichthys lucidus]|uniref:2-(3-amino-3-carboxypropyl)histidine synthase subunit 2 n=1 Tax=Collichthys lucidus TaxID=240159 RepID=A0A4U5VJC7_COLLU|nr:2-(3-amino-3-carboxypropyl)histidine synthase subunit 2 [Collichthys lucidus]
MVLKQCHSRFKQFRVNHPEKWYDLCFNRDRVGGFVTARLSGLTAVNASPCVHGAISPSSRYFVQPLLRRRQAFRQIIHLSTATHMSTRGFTTQQAEVLVKILVRMTNSNMDVIYNDMVTKVQQDVMNKLRSDTILDMNLEKSRVKELALLTVTMADAFSSSSETVIQRVVDVAVKINTPLEKLEELYQIKETCEFITERQFQKFSDELLVDSVAVAVEIERNCNVKPFILGDTSYGSCCVDEVAAEHVGADCIVHYGSACLSPSKRLPLMYVFERRPVDLEKCTSAFRELYPDTQSHIILLYDVSYVHAINDLLIHLSPEYPNLVLSELVVEGEQCYIHGWIKRQNDDTCLSKQDDSQVIRQFGRQFSLKSGLSITDYSVFYVGQEGATLRNFMMTWNRCSFCSFDPITMIGRTESVSINRTLMKRYYAIERAKDANVVGILVGTLGVADYLSIIQQLKETIHKAGKKSYIFAMGKLNVPKLANFLEIDIFVLIACPENSLLDSSEFYKPVVTPFEMEVACNKKREWSEEYVIDFRHLLPGGQSHVPLADQQEDGDETDVSLITGALRSQNLLISEPAESSCGSSVVLRNQTLTVANTNTAASFLATRSWRGLEQKLGETPVVKAGKGRKGIAIAYEEEGTSK